MTETSKPYPVWLMRGIRTVNGQATIVHLYESVEMTGCYQWHEVTKPNEWPDYMATRFETAEAGIAAAQRNWVPWYSTPETKTIEAVKFLYYPPVPHRLELAPTPNSSDMFAKY